MKKLKNRIMYWLGIVPRWNRCTKASCWDGSNAKRRMMNILSPFFTDAKFREYVAWMEARGCNTAHIFVANQGDGEGAGYYATDNANLSRKRIKYLRIHGFAIVPWLMADDSSAYAKAMFSNADAYVKGLKEAGLFAHASFMCLGLEMDEYGKMDDWIQVRNAIAKHCPKMKVATHHTSGRLTFAGIGDIVCDQLEPRTATAGAIAASIGRILAMGKAAIGFEYSRQADRDKAQAAFSAGAFSVGNW